MTSDRVRTLPLVNPPPITPLSLQTNENTDDDGRLVLNLQQTLTDEKNTNTN